MKSLMTSLCSGLLPIALTAGTCTHHSLAFSADTVEQENIPALEQRIQQQQRTAHNAFVITPRDRNYALPLSYNHNPNTQPYERFDDRGKDLDKTEVKFQLSLAVPLVQGLFDGYANLSAGYTMTSWWQAYNQDISSPFRETNHAPELYFSFPVSMEVLGSTLRIIEFGGIHQSNGQTQALSRSWNRIFTTFVFERGNLAWAVKPWYRIPESKKKNPDDAKGDDNPDILKYMGYGEVAFSYKLQNHSLGMLFRNNLRGSGNKGAVQLDWAFPLFGRLRGYVQYFNGYGESLIDYNASANRLSLGVLLTDWL